MAALLVAPGAFAQATGPATQSAPSFPEIEDDEPPPPPVPLARDTLSGHFVAGLGGAVEAPFGNLRAGEKAANLGAGAGAAIDLGFGVSRSLAAGAWGNVLSFGSGQTSFSVGPFVRYHLVQGLRFDPWVLLGVGYRSQRRDSPLGQREFSGFEFLHAVLGGDYYVWSGVAFGPFIELDGGVFTKRPKTTSTGQPDTASVGSAVHLGFAAGLRVVLDLPGK